VRLCPGPRGPEVHVGLLTQDLQGVAGPMPSPGRRWCPSFPRRKPQVTKGSHFSTLTEMAPSSRAGQSPLLLQPVLMAAIHPFPSGSWGGMQDPKPSRMRGTVGRGKRPHAPRPLLPPNSHFRPVSAPLGLSSSQTRPPKNPPALNPALRVSGTDWWGRPRGEALPWWTDLAAPQPLLPELSPLAP
jgi:hypothetical protein